MCYIQLALISRKKPPNTEFYGREDELKELMQLLKQKPQRVIFLTGPADIGKSELVKQVRSGITQY